MDAERKLTLNAILREQTDVEEVTRGASPRMRPSENHLFFDVVVRHGSIRKAAEALHIASSALNRRMLDLEEEVGVPLFERLPRGVRPTAAGELLLGYVRQSLKGLRQLEAQIDQLRGQVRGSVSIAVAESVTPSLLPDAILAYRQRHPGIAFHVIVDGPDSLGDALAGDRVDLILTHRAPERPTMSVLARAVHQLCAHVVDHHPLACRDSITLADCVDFPLALPDRTLAARALIEEALEEASLHLVPALESDSVETLKWFARLGEAICLSFHLGSERETQGLVAVPIRNAHCGQAHLYLAARRGRVLPVAAATFAEELAKTLSGGTAIRRVSTA